MSGEGPPFFVFSVCPPLRLSSFCIFLGRLRFLLFFSRYAVQSLYILTPLFDSPPTHYSRSPFDIQIQSSLGAFLVQTFFVSFVKQAGLPVCYSVVSCRILV